MCRVCSLDSLVLQDTDGREGYISGRLSFGPNAINGIVNEDPVTGYSLYLVDQCGVQIGAPLATVAKRPGVPQGCCAHGAYTFEVKDAVLPLGHGKLRLVVVPFTPAGPVPVGEMTDVVHDFVEAGSGKASVANGCRRVVPVMNKALAMVAFATIVIDLVSLPF